MLSYFIAGALSAAISLGVGQYLGVRVRDYRLGRRLDQEMDEVATLVPELVTKEELRQVLGILAQAEQEQIAQAQRAAAAEEEARRARLMKQMNEQIPQVNDALAAQMAEMQQRLERITRQVSPS